MSYHMKKLHKLSYSNDGFIVELIKEFLRSWANYVIKDSQVSEKKNQYKLLGYLSILN